MGAHDTFTHPEFKKLLADTLMQYERRFLDGRVKIALDELSPRDFTQTIKGNNSLK